MDSSKSAVHVSPMTDCCDTAGYMDVEHSETTDSGVQLLDSESTEMNASMVISGTGFDEDEHSPVIEEPNCDINGSGDLQQLTRSDIENSNIPATKAVADDDDDDDEGAEEHLEQEPITESQKQPPPPPPSSSNIDDLMVSSQCSTFDTNETTVFRRRPKRATHNIPKKRVSFHEDILKNTKTDNIHIEHGFITYKNGVRQQSAGAAALAGGRYSWCAKGSEHGEFQDSAEDPDYVIYRNACSEVLDYGKTDIYDGEGEPPTCDNSGVFEYADSQNGNLLRGDDTLYQCHCSDSNSSLESNAVGAENAVDVNSNQVRANYAQTKSSSCECIGAQQPHPQKDPFLTDNCYYSEPNIGTSVWSKEKKPKSSCLKKTKYPSFETQQHSEEAIAARTNAVRKFNIHAKKKNSRTGDSETTPTAVVTVNQLLDNGKSIFGSLKNIFGMPLPERGVPEGQEDAQAVHEEVQEEQEGEDRTEPLRSQDHSPMQASPGSKTRSFLSRSFDGGFHEKLSSPNKKTFIHSVDEQLRKKAAGDTSERASPKRTVMARSLGAAESPQAGTGQPKQEVYRNKFIVNCESTVFEHTGVSISYEGDSCVPNEEPPKQAEPVATTSQSYLTQKISRWTNMFRSSTANTKEAPQPTGLPSPAVNTNSGPSQSPSDREEVDAAMDTYGAGAESGRENTGANDVMECSFASSNSTMTDVSSIVSTPTVATATSSSDPPTTTTTTTPSGSGDGFSKIFGGHSSPSHRGSNRTPTRHLPSPRRRKSTHHHQHHNNPRMSPDLFNNYVQLMGSRAPINDLRTSSLLSEDFDDILTVTTTNDTMTSSSTMDRQEDMVIVDYPEITIPDHPDDSDFLKPASTKSSLINRFLRNVTQKKIMEATVALNRKLVAAGEKGVIPGRPVVGQLYVRGVRPMNRDLIEDLNAEIAMEMEQNKQEEGCGVTQATVDVSSGGGEIAEKPVEFETENGFGVGEIPLAIFKSVTFPFIGALLPEFLMKVFKLYIGYDRDGIMTPVLVFLTNKTLYVTDLVRSTLCNKFVMPFAELDVILLGPHGNTVLLCNGDRDMQQVLLAGGSHQANSLVSSLEICARRGGLQLPSIGQLTLDHLAPLQHFVRDNSKTVDRREKWLYYAVVSISPMTTSGGFTEVQEQLGANINGPLMHRSMNKAGMPVSQWSASYFLLKAGVLYMFPTTTSNVHSTQRLPSWAVTLTECQGVRRMMNAGRPHCFELLLKAGALQLAGSDEYATSDWMQALVQSASGLFELEEKRSHYGCTLVLTSSHIITLREDFTEPLRRVGAQKAPRDVAPVVDDSGSRSSSALSTPNRSVVGIGAGGALRKRSSGDLVASSISAKSKEAVEKKKGSYGKMCSEYGKDSGMEILSCADTGELISVKVSERSSVWWCSLEFSCQECVQENSDVVVHFATESEHERFLAKLEEVWRARTKAVAEFPLQRVVEGEDSLADHCTKLFTDINRMWDPLVAAALGYPK